MRTAYTRLHPPQATPHTPPSSCLTPHSTPCTQLHAYRIHPLASTTGHTARLTQLQLGTTGSMLLSASTDDLVRLWDVRCCTRSSGGGSGSNLNPNHAASAAAGGYGAPGGGAVAHMNTGHMGTTALLLDGGRMQVCVDGWVWVWVWVSDGFFVSWGTGRLQVGVDGWV